MTEPAPLVINCLTDFKSALKTPGLTIRGLFHWRQDEPRLAHFMTRFKTQRAIKSLNRSYFDIEGGSRLDVTAKAGWLFDGTDTIVLQLNPTDRISYRLEIANDNNPQPQQQPEPVSDTRTQDA